MQISDYAWKNIPAEEEQSNRQNTFTYYVSRVLPLYLPVIIYSTH